MQKLRGLRWRRLQILRLLQRYDKVWRSGAYEADLRKGNLHSFFFLTQYWQFSFSASMLAPPAASVCLLLSLQTRRMEQRAQSSGQGV